MTISDDTVTVHRTEEHGTDWRTVYGPAKDHLQLEFLSQRYNYKTYA